MQPCRLALIAHRFQRNDGQGRVNYEVARRSAAVGHQLTLLTAYCAPELSSARNVRVVIIGSEGLPSQLLRDLAFALESSAWIRTHRDAFDLIQANGFTTWERCDIVTAHFVHTAWAKSPWYPFRGAVTPQFLYQRLFTAVNACFEKIVYRRAAKIVAVSDAVASEVMNLGVPSQKTEVVYNGVDADEYRPGPPERDAFALPSGVLLGLFVGDIRTTRKNLDTVLLALQRLPQLHLAVAGETKGSAFPAMAERLGLQERVHFLGKTHAIPALMRSVDLFVFPSRYEAHPLVVLEAMASGLPSVLAATVGSASRFSECFRILQDPDDAERLAALIQELLEDASLRTSLGQEARKRALDLSWDRTADQYLAIYEGFQRSQASAFAHEDVFETVSR